MDAAEPLADVSRETLDLLRQFERLFRAEAARVNLVAASTLPDLWERHILDSAQLRNLKPNATRWLDLGTGGGFPGLVLAILLKDVDGARVDLVESTGKKAQFLRTAAAQLHLPAHVWNERIETMPPKLPQPEVVSARALAALPALLGLARPWLARGAVGLFHKGQRFRQELEESRALWRFDVIEHESMTDSASAILEISRLRPV